jgi:glyoxylase-like metal-dependent hydrolase (beta-lactamase superfamily II)
MAISRRRFHHVAMLGAGAAIASSPLARALAPNADDATLFDWRPVKGRDGLRVAFGNGGNAMAIQSEGRIALVDAKHAGIGATLRAEAERFGGRVERLINTHHHADHTGGNAAFRPDLPILAHPNLGPRVAMQVDRFRQVARSILGQMRGSGAPEAAIERAESFVSAADDLQPESFWPTELITNERTLRVGSLRVECYHTGHGHTDNDVYVFLPERNVLHAGDLLFHELHPFVDRAAGATTEGWQDRLDEMMNLCDPETIVVPGHGEITDRTGLRRQREYFDIMREWIDQQVRRGVSREAAAEMQPPAALSEYGFMQIWPRTVAAMHDEATGTPPSE